MTTGTGGGAGSVTTGSGGGAGSVTTGTGGGAGSVTTGTGGGAGTTSTGTGGTAGVGGSGTGGKAGSGGSGGIGGAGAGGAAGHAGAGGSAGSGGSAGAGGVACTTAASCNDSTKVCVNNSCAACTSNSDCSAAYGANHVCNNGACIAGNCLVKGDCAASGLICGAQTAHTCGTCSGANADAACVNEYGANHICNGGVCITGSCHDSSGCTAGQVCDLTTHTCKGCGTGGDGDATCQNDTKYGPTYICQSNACRVGNCHAASDCSTDGTKVCKNFTCGTCGSNTDCTDAYGANHVCSGGACISGNCNNSGECGGNQLCINHACTPCTAGSTGDAQCVGDTTYGPMHICLAGQCVAGDCHDKSSECMGGHICGATVAHTCGACGSGTAGDNACKADTATYGSGYICLSGGCVQGDCHDTSNDCSAGQICGVSAAHTCGNCGGSGNTGDTQCNGDQRYMGDICYQGLCGPGNCHATSADCTGNNAGFVCGVTAANTCGPCTTDSQCKSDKVYGANDICNTATGQCVSGQCTNNNAACTANGGDFCCSGSCVAGNCCVDNDCGAVGSACVNHTCTACNAVSGNKWYVDPVNGNDATATGSGMSGSTVAPGCAFKTITAAIAHMGATPFAGSQIIIVGSSGTTTGLSGGDTLPMNVPTNTTLTTTGGPVTISVGANGAFRLLNNNSGISGGTGAPLVLDGANKTGGIAVLVQPGTSTFTMSISNVTIQNNNSDGIRVTNGTLTVGPGVVVNNTNSDGIRVSGGAANIDNPAGTQTVFENNALYGIEVTGTGSVTINGTPGSPVPSNSGTIVCTGNAIAGIRIGQTPGAANLVMNTIKGLVAWGNSTDGMRLAGGSKVKVRGSLLLANAQYGVRVSSAANTAAGNDLSGLDLGVPGDPGQNYVQVPLGAAGLNAGGGVCVALTACTLPNCVGPLTEEFLAEGNFLVSSTGNLQVDCSTSTSAITKGACGSLRSAGINTATNITTTIDVAGCM